MPPDGIPHRHRRQSSTTSCAGSGCAGCGAAPMVSKLGVAFIMLNMLPIIMPTPTILSSGYFWSHERTQRFFVTESWVGNIGIIIPFLEMNNWKWNTLRETSCHSQPAGLKTGHCISDSGEPLQQPRKWHDDWRWSRESRGPGCSVLTRAIVALNPRSVQL